MLPVASDMHRFCATYGPFGHCAAVGAARMLPVASVMHRFCAVSYTHLTLPTILLV